MAKNRYKYTTAKQWGGDDGYQWAIFVRGQYNPVVCGLTRREVPYYRDKIEKAEDLKAHGIPTSTDLEGRGT